MRTIHKRPPPPVYVEWRAARMSAARGPGMECTYDELRRAPAVLEAVEEQLCAEQGGLCAYTGRGLSLSRGVGGERRVGFHLEHLTPQMHCVYGQDADISNLVACWPPPNGPKAPYGAHEKDHWPSPQEAHLFVSPLDPTCGQRLRFRANGVVEPANEQDEAAAETVRRLGLDHPTLVALRRGAIQGTLSPRMGQRLTAAQTRTLLQRLGQDEADLERGLPVRLREFCFALRHALERHLRSFG